MPGLELCRVDLTRYIPQPPYNPTSLVQVDRSIVINGTDFGAPDTEEQMAAYYTAVVQALKSGQPIYWEREVEALAGRLSYSGDIHRFWIKNQTSEPIGMPIGWTHESKYGPFDFTEDGYLWVELGYPGESGRVTATQYGPSDPELFSYNGVLYIPPGEWDLNFSIGCRTIWESGTYGDGISKSTLWMPQAPPSSPRHRRRRAAWVDLERPAFF